MISNGQSQRLIRETSTWLSFEGLITRLHGAVAQAADVCPFHDAIDATAHLGETRHTKTSQPVSCTVDMSAGALL